MFTKYHPNDGGDKWGTKRTLNAHADSKYLTMDGEVGWGGRILHESPFAWTFVFIMFSLQDRQYREFWLYV